MRGLAALKTKGSTAFSIALRRLREKQWIVVPLLVGIAIWGFVLAFAQRREKAVNVLMEVHRRARQQWLRNAVEPYVREHVEVFHGNVAAHSRLGYRLDWKRLLVLKPPLPNGEKGVLLVMFNQTLAHLYSCMDVERLLKDYTLVLEPSWPGFCDADLLRYTRFDDDVFVLCAVPYDYAFLQHLASNLVPVDLAPCDWVDPRVAEPYLNVPKEFDIVMNAIWASFKRHYVLFRMLAGARRRYRVALIGASWDRRTKSEIEREAKYYGVRDLLTIFESIPYESAMQITCKSRVSMLLSLKEAGPRSIAESIFCDVPVVVSNRLIAGIVKSVVPQTGIVAAECELERAVQRLHQGDIRPRSWGLNNISCLKSSERLNALLRLRALSCGRPWSQNIATRTSSPECTYYASVDEARLRGCNDALQGYLRS